MMVDVVVSQDAPQDWLADYNAPMMELMNRRGSSSQDDADDDADDGDDDADGAGNDDAKADCCVTTWPKTS